MPLSDICLYMHPFEDVYKQHRTPKRDYFPGMFSPVHHSPPFLFSIYQNSREISQNSLGCVSVCGGGGEDVNWQTGCNSRQISIGGKTSDTPNSRPSSFNSLTSI